MLRRAARRKRAAEQPKAEDGRPGSCATPKEAGCWAGGARGGVAIEEETQRQDMSSPMGRNGPGLATGFVGCVRLCAARGLLQCGFLKASADAKAISEQFQYIGCHEGSMAHGRFS